MLLAPVPAMASGALVWNHDLVGGQGAPTAVLTDDADNVYLAAQFAGPLSLDGNPSVSPADVPGAKSVVAKFDSAGQFLWWKFLSFNVHDAAVGPASNLLLAGSFTNAVDADPGPGVATLTATHATDAVVVELDPNGVFVQAFAISGDNDQTVDAIAVDDSGNIHVAGSYSGWTDFDPLAGDSALAPLSDTDLYVAKYNPDATLAWVRAFESAGRASAAAPADLAIDNQGGVIATGHFTGAYDFDPGPDVHLESTASPRDGFVVKLDADGNYEFSGRVGGNSNDETRAVAVDSEDNVFLAGYFTETADLDPGPGVEEYMSAGHSDGYVLKLDAQGNRVWLRALVGPGVTDANDLHLDKDGNLHLAGAFGGGVSLLIPTTNASPETLLEIFGATDMIEPEVYTVVDDEVSGGAWHTLALKLNPEGRLQAVTTYEALSPTEGLHVAADDAGRSVVAGRIQGAGPQPGPADAPGTPNTYVLKLGYPSDTVWVDFAGTRAAPDGSPEAPYQTLHQGVSQVIPNGTVKIRGDSPITISYESCTVQKPVRIEAVNGPVTIGAP